MSETVLEQSLQIILQETTAAAVVAVLLAAGLVGMSIRTMVESVVTSDENPDVGEPISDGGSVTTTEDSAVSGGEHGDSRATDRPNAETGESEELEHRLDELEHEVDTLSSTVNTVRNENEQIANSVQDIEENTGRLLNLYQMATRGVNPFSSGEPSPKETTRPESTEETTQAECAESTHTREDEIERIEPGTKTVEDGEFGSETTDALSSGAGVREQHCVDSVEEIVETETEPEDAFQKRKQRAVTTADRSEKSVDGVEEISEGATGEEFSEEASEETFGKEEMIETAADGPTTAASDGGMLIEESDDDEMELETSTPDAETSTPPIPEDDQQLEASAEPAETTRSSVQELDARLSTEPETATETAAVTTPTVAPTSSSEGKPYIESLPEGFTAEVLTIEWLEYLIEEVGLAKTIRAVHYYESIGWITEETAAELDSYLSGFDTAESGSLAVEHHLRSLEYVEELTATDEMSETTGEKL